MSINECQEEILVVLRCKITIIPKEIQSLLYVIFAQKSVSYTLPRARVRAPCVFCFLPPLLP